MSPVGWPALMVLSLIQAPVSSPVAPVQWHLSPRPAMTIGREGDEHTEFLRVGRVLRMAGGQIVVPNAGTREIRVFDQAGRYLRAIGREGAGPGEFRDMSLVARVGDSLFVADGVNSRITVVLITGTLIKTIPIAARDAVARFSVVGRFGDGSWAVVTVSSPNIYGPQRTYRDTAHVGILDSKASSGVVWIGTYPGLTFFVHNPDNGPQGDVVGVVPLAPTAVTAMSGNEILIGDTGANVIGAYSSAGARLRLIQLPLEAQPLSDERIAQARKQALDQNPSPRSRPYLTALNSRAAMGPALPVFRSLLPAEDGSIWVEPFPAGPAAPVTWLILESDGTLRASVMVPGGFRISEVGSSYVLGVYTDPAGVETVRMYGLTTR